MSSLSPYIHFDGTTRQALEFYKDVIGGELQIMTIGETPWAQDAPGVDASKSTKVMHASLTKGSWILMAADMMESDTFTPGDTVSLCLVCDSKAEIEKIYQRLSEGGDVFSPLDRAPFGWFASVTDRFGVDWMLQYQGDA